jgi:hypothetical protein
VGGRLPHPSDHEAAQGIGTGRYVQTISKGGYRLIAEVARAEHAGLVQIPADAESLHVDRNRRVQRLLIGSAAGLIIMAGAILVDVARETTPGVSVERSLAATHCIQKCSSSNGCCASIRGTWQRSAGTVAGSRPDGVPVTDLRKCLRFPLRAFPATPNKLPVKSRTRPQLFAMSFPARYQRIDERLRLQVHLTDAQTGKQCVVRAIRTAH